MEGYDVVDLDDHKVGHVVETKDGFLILETGLLRKKKYAVPLDTARADDDEKVVRLTIAKTMVEEGPPVKSGETDWQSINDYYGLPAVLEGENVGVEPDEEVRARIRKSLSGPEAELGPPKGAVGIHQDRWEVKE